MMQQYRPAVEPQTSGRAITPSPDQPDRRRAHVERMLVRAEKRSRQASKLVDKWKARLVNLDREGVAAKQARLWSEDHSDPGLGGASPGAQA